MEIFITLTKYNTYQWHEEGNHYLWWLSIFSQFVIYPTNQTRLAQGLFKVDWGAGPLPRHPRQLQKCLKPHQHSPKKGCLRHQAINLALLRRIRAWEDDSLRLEEGRLHDMNARLPWCSCYAPTTKWNTAAKVLIFARLHNRVQANFSLISYYILSQFWNSQIFKASTNTQPTRPRLIFKKLIFHRCYLN